VTTTNLRQPARRWFDLPVPAAAGIIIFAIYLIVGLVWQLRSAPSAAVVPTPGLIILIATQPAAIVPTAAAVVAAVVPENVTQRAIGVFGAPDTASYIGSVEAGRVFSPVARYGVEWTQVDMDGSGRVFVRTSDLYGVPELVDLQPAPTALVIERPVYVASQPREAAPTQPAPVVVAPQTQVLLDRQQWALDAQRAGR
jgi:hypothetical protein